MNLSALAFFGPIGPLEMAIFGIIALLLFGKRLPDVARSVGRSIVEFKKGIKDVKGEINEQARLEPPDVSRIEGKPSTGADAPSAPASSSTTGPSDRETPA